MRTRIEILKDLLDLNIKVNNNSQLIINDDDFKKVYFTLKQELFKELKEFVLCDFSIEEGKKLTVDQIWDYFLNKK